MRLGKLEELQNHFWQRYAQEIIPLFHQMNKWISKRENFEVGDLVATTDKKVRGRWPLAKVINVVPDSEGIVRQVDVLQKGEPLRRHVKQLLLLTKL